MLASEFSRYLRLTASGRKALGKCESFLLPASLSSSMMACEKAIKLLGYVFLEYEENYIRTRSVKKPLQLEITCRSTSTESTEVIAAVCSSGFGPADSVYMAKELTYLRLQIEKILLRSQANGLK